MLCYLYKLFVAPLLQCCVECAVDDFYRTRTKELVKWLSWAPSLRWSLWWGWSAQPGSDFGCWSHPSTNVAPRPTASSTWSRYRMVVFPALSRPRMRILTSPADVPTHLREGISLGGRWLGKALLRVLQVIFLFAFGDVPFGKSASAVASLFPKRDPKIDENRMPMFLASRATRLFRAGGGVDFSMGLKVNPRKAKKSTVLDMFDITTQYAIISFSGYSETIA